MSSSIIQPTWLYYNHTRKTIAWFFYCITNSKIKCKHSERNYKMNLNCYRQCVAGRSIDDFRGGPKEVQSTGMN